MAMTMACTCKRPPGSTLATCTYPQCRVGKQSHAVEVAEAKVKAAQAKLNELGGAELPLFKRNNKWARAKFRFDEAVEKLAKLYGLE